MDCVSVTDSQDYFLPIISAFSYSIYCKGLTNANLSNGHKCLVIVFHQIFRKIANILTLERQMYILLSKITSLILFENTTNPLHFSFTSKNDFSPRREMTYRLLPRSGDHTIHRLNWLVLLIQLIK